VRAADGGWEIAESRFTPGGAGESVFAVANGFLGLRGTPEEGTPVHDPGAILNGFHETWPIVYPEDAHGLARTGQTIVGAPDGSIVRLVVDGEPFDPASVRVSRFERVLDMRHGLLRRTVEFETASGARVLVRSRRLVSLEDRHLAVIDYEVVALDTAVQVEISSELVTHSASDGSDDPRRGKGLGTGALLPCGAAAEGARAVLRAATRNSGLELVAAMHNAVDTVAPSAVEATADADRARFVVRATLAPGAPLRLTKFLAYHWGARDAGDELTTAAARTLDRAARVGYGAVELEHRRHVRDFWERSDVVLEGDPELQRAVRFNLFQLLQATARAEGLGVPAKGVTGLGYEGHYFWDTEIYVLPFLIHTTPSWARSLLEFRVGMLPAARERAREVGHAGALFAWRTISGAEASAWYAAGTAQYHINADIAHAMHHYNRVTGDLGFMLDRGAEALVETARLWLDLGFFSDRRDGAFCIHGVTGPDEYTTVVDNNAYTNLMAREHLEIAVRVIEWLQASDPQAYAELARATALTSTEVHDWRRAAERMLIPRHTERGIVMQDEHFLDRKPWDFANTPPAKHPLLLHYHPLELYRHQVIKQTDVVLATYLVGHHFSAEEKRRTFDYYDPLTTGDSTLSASIQSVIAGEVGYPDRALEYFKTAATVDLHDSHGNTRDGIHIAAAGGTWLALVAGFAGLRDFDGDVHLSPRLPGRWTRLSFRLQIRGQQIGIDMTHHGTTYTLLHGAGLPITHHGEPLRLRPGRPLRLPAREELPMAA
jgi:alpha,alpha-trehalose phosphorylase